MQLRANFKRLGALTSGPIARSAISGMSLRLFGLGLVFVQAVIAARLLGAEQYGIVSLLLAAVQIATAFVLFGFSGYAVAEIPRLLATNMTRGVSRFVRHSLSRIALASLVVLPVVAVAMATITSTAKPAAIALALVCVPLLATLQLFRGVALGLERPILAQAPIDIVRPALLIAALLIVWLIYSVDSVVFLGLYAAAVALSLFIALPSIRDPQQSDRSNAATKPEESAQDWDRAARPFLAMQLVTILEVELATILLGIFATPEAVGLFQPVARMSVVLFLPVYALNLRFAPRIATLNAAGKRSDIIRLARKFTLSSSVVVVLSGLAIGFASPWLLLLFGPEFPAAAPIVWLIVAGRVGAAILGPAIQLLTMTGNSWRAVQANATGLGFEVVLGAIMISHFGLLGAGISVATGMILRAILAARNCASTLGIGVAEFWFTPDGKRNPA